MPHAIATVISQGKASYSELDTSLGLEDMWWLLEIITVDNINRRAAEDAASKG